MNRSARALLSVTAAATLVTGGLAATTAPAQAAAPRTAITASTATAGATYSTEVLRLVNKERTKRGLKPFKLSACAKSFAVRQSSRIASSSSLFHQDLGTVLRGCGARGAGENVAYGSVSPAQMVAMWMASPGHRANILKPSFTHLGVGSQAAGNRWYGAQVFLTQ